MDKYYYKRDKTWNEENYFNRINEMMAFEKTLFPLVKNFSTIIPR
jgi:spore coat-associated protein S